MYLTEHKQIFNNYHKLYECHYSSYECDPLMMNKRGPNIWI